MKVLIVGEEGSGKTTFLTRLRTDQFNQTHIPTLGVEVHQVMYNPSTMLQMWDLAGRDGFYGQTDVIEGYYANADVCLIFVDLSKDMTNARYRRIVEGYMEDVREVCSDIYFIVVGSKFDLALGRNVRLHDALHGLDFTRFKCISSQSAYGMDYILNTIVGSTIQHY